MTRHRFPRSLCAAATACALSLAPIACKDEKTEDKAASSAGADKSTDAGKAAGDAKADGESGKPVDGAGAGGKSDGLAGVAMGAVAALSPAKDIVPSYPIALDPLLDLVPADAESFVVIRDVGGLAEASLALMDVQREALAKIEPMVARDDPGDAAEMREAMAAMDKIGPELGKSGIDLSVGAVLAKRKSGGSVFVYGATTPDALPLMLTALGADMTDSKTTCVSVPGATGYAACAETDAGPYAPGKSASTWRSRMEAELPGVDLERANIVALVAEDGQVVPIAVETGQGMAHAAFAVSELRSKATGKIEAGPAPALGLVGAGQPFLWARVSPTMLADEARSAPAMATNLVKTLTGEFLFGGLAGSPGMMVLAGLNDPAPAAGLTALASLGFEQVPKALPDGSTLALELKTITVPSVPPIQSVHASITGGKSADLAKKLGYAAELYAFAAGKYGAVTMGAGESVVGTIAEYAGTGPSGDTLAPLPPALRTGLTDGKVAAAAFLPFDALQSDTAATVAKTALESMPEASAMPIDPAEAMRVAANFVAPLSSVSVWVTDVEVGPVFHVGVQGFADSSTEEGKAAIEAMKAVAKGASAKDTYGALAAKYPSSPRVWSYKARAGEAGDAMASVVTIGGLMAAAGAMLFMRSMGTSAMVPPPVPMPMEMPAKPIAPPAP